MACFYTVTTLVGISFCAFSGFGVGELSFYTFLEMGLAGYGIFETIFVGVFYY
jgi:hypothetical protein